MDWKTMLAYITGSVDEDLLLRNEYLTAENRILRAQLPGRLTLTDGDRRTWRWCTAALPSTSCVGASGFLNASQRMIRK